METLLRQWAMLRLIPRYPRRIDTGRIRDELLQVGYDITLRTIQCDLNKLSAVLPLVSDQSKPQGWWWQGTSKNSRLVPPGSGILQSEVFIN